MNSITLFLWKILQFLNIGECNTDGDCTGSTDTCNAGICKCGQTGDACSTLTDTCNSGSCQCGSQQSSCNPKTADMCSDGECKCGNTVACPETSVCTSSVLGFTCIGKI